MNDADSLFWHQFLDHQAQHLGMFLIDQFEKHNLLPTHVTMMQLKPKLQEGFYIHAEIHEPFTSFMHRNDMTWRDVELGIFDRLWADFEKNMDEFYQEIRQSHPSVQST